MLDTADSEPLSGQPLSPALLRVAERVCDLRGTRLTPLRRSVLELLAVRETPCSAYDLRDALCARQGRSVAPITVYRVLKFLCELRLVLRLETRNAYVACRDPSSPGARVLLICEACSRVQSVEDQAVRSLLETDASAAGFRIVRETVEIEGICSACTDGELQTASPSAATPSSDHNPPAKSPEVR